MTPHRYSSAEDMYRQAYSEVLDFVAGEVERWFDQADLGMVCELESLLISAANGDGKGAVQIGRSVAEYLEVHVDINRLQMQLAMLPDAIRTTFKDPPAPKKVTSVRTLVDVMNESEVVRNMLGEVDKVLKLYMTFPVTSVTSKRSFSSVRCI